MTLEQDDYVFDSHGNRLLVGLTLEETREFERLDALIASLVPTSYFSTGYSSNGIRWLELFEKHEAALEAFRSGPRPNTSTACV
jgi:hypothetical protein